MVLNLTYDSEYKNIKVIPLNINKINLYILIKEIRI